MYCWILYWFYLDLLSRFRIEVIPFSLKKKTTPIKKILSTRYEWRYWSLISEMLHWIQHSRCSFLKPSHKIINLSFISRTLLTLRKCVKGFFLKIIAAFSSKCLHLLSLSPQLCSYWASQGVIIIVASTLPQIIHISFEEILWGKRAVK